MVLEAPPVHRHEVYIVTPRFQINGQLETVGTTFTFINDAKRESLPLYEVTITPLRANGPLASFTRPHIILRRSEIVLLYFTSAETRSEIHTLRRRELLVVYTPPAVCRGYFHMADEAQLSDFIEDTVGTLLPITEVQIFSLDEFPTSFPAEAELLLIGRSYLEFYHPE